jgi:hypothetical protein
MDSAFWYVMRLWCAYSHLYESCNSFEQAENTIFRYSLHSFAMLSNFINGMVRAAGEATSTISPPLSQCRAFNIEAEGTDLKPLLINGTAHSFESFLQWAHRDEK